MGEKGSKQEWIAYFAVVNGRAPTEAEITAARDIYDDEDVDTSGNAPNLGAEAETTEQPAGAMATTQADASVSQAASAATVGAISAGKGDGQTFADGAQVRPIDDVKHFFTQKQWRDKTAWQALVRPTEKLPTTMAVINVLLGGLWLIVTVNLSSLTGNIRQLAAQFGLMLQSGGRSSTANNQEIQKMMAAVNNPATVARIITVLLALVMVAVAVNYLYQVVKVKKPLYWLVGSDAVTGIAGIGGYLALQSALNTVVVSQKNYTLNNVLDMANAMMTGVGQTLTNSSGGLLGAVTSNSNFVIFVQRYAAYLGGIMGSLHAVLTLSMILGLVGGVLAVTGAYLFLKKKWGTPNGQ
jgi:hypothetical protein